MRRGNVLPRYTCHSAQHNNKNMQKYIIINGKNIAFIEAETMKDAVTYCQNYCNHSEEVIVREYVAIKALIND